MSEVVFPFDVDSLFERYVRNKTMPKNDFKKQAVLIVLIRDFEDKKIYAETEVNAIISKHFEDVAFLRRELVNFGYLRRNSEEGSYDVRKRTLTTEDIANNTLLARHAKAFGY